MARVPLSRRGSAGASRLEPANESAKDGRRRGRFALARVVSASPLLSLVVAGATVLAMILAVPGALVAWQQLGGHDAQSSTQSTGEPAATASPLLSALPGTPQQTSGCWVGRSTDPVPIACDEEHDHEEFPVGGSDCDRTAAISYLGGVAGVDVVTTGVRVFEFDGKCLVQAPQPQMTTFRDALVSDASAAWRSCYDGLRRREVPCSQAHTGEFVGAGGGRTRNEDDCLQPATDYLGTSYSLFRDRLGVTNTQGGQDDPTAARCLLRTYTPRLAIPVILRNTDDVQFDLIEMS